MNYVIDTPLTMTGLIATLVSLVFAGAAWYNSHRRRKHFQQQAVSRSPVVPPAAEVSIPHKPLFIPPEAVIPTTPLPKAQTPIQQREPPQSLPWNSAPLFKKLGVNGLEEPSQAAEDKQYRWE